MPSKTVPKSTDSAARGRGSSSFVNDYLADWDQDDPFRSPSPEPAKNDNNDGSKKKDVLGIEKELDLKRKPRAPRVKLDETRLLSDKGIPKLRKTAQRLKFKGKGHEYNDAARLLSFYQEWLDDLFPKATFLDALAMVEKAGHKTTMRNARLQWIDETKPKPAMAEDEEEYRIRQGSSASRQSDKIAPIFENTTKATQGRARTPAADDLFEDDDIYNATPLRNTGGTAPSRQLGNDGVPDDDDLDALMAEAEADSGNRTRPAATAPAFESIFGNGARTAAPISAGEPDDDDLDALMAEAEAETRSDLTRPGQPATGGSIFEDGKSKKQATQQGGNDGDDLDALMAEAEADIPVFAQSSRTGEKVSNSDIQPADGSPAMDDGEDDLDAFMAEAEAGLITTTRPLNGANAASSVHADTGGPMASFEDDEEAMAEMDGLW
ncbi:Swi3-domain-containing protein [Parathielavia appendiculata]|uniref:Chromosome segregation in meiosis protein n=1 Tax=Parathielavia appendiculata TaxID=2587402 RepID=A0AAN6Z4C1_9PEZI|nr:Swi3-domain-containing protein [Parathielavia appendiculata]